MVVAGTREKIAELAHRPLRVLRLTALSPDVATTLPGLALPLGANRLELTVEVRGTPRSGGEVLFQAVEVPLNDAAGPLDLARTVHDALPARDRRFEATLELGFGEAGRPGLAAQLRRLVSEAPEAVRLEAEFGPEAAGGAA